MKEGGAAAGWLIGWTRLVARHRVVAAVVLVGMGVLFSWMSRRIEWQPDVLAFFSGDSEEVQSMRRAAGEAGVATQMRFDVHGDGVSMEDLRGAAEKLAAGLRGSGEFGNVWTGVDEGELAGRYAKLAGEGVILLDEEEQKAAEGRATREFLAGRFAAVKEKLADPDGEILLRQLAADPLDLSRDLAGRLRGLSPGAKSGVGMEGGMLVAREGGDGESGAAVVGGAVTPGKPGAIAGVHIMIVGQPRVAPSDQRGAERVMEAVWGVVEKVRGRFPGVGVWVVGAHRAYVENAARVVRDVSMVSLVGTLAVVVAIAIYFRRVMPAVLCMIPPVVGVGLALGLAGMGGVTLPLILLGFAGLLSGSTTDYGLQIIAECRRIFARERKWDESIPARAAGGMMGAITMSVVTSVTGFAALALSASPGLRGLGLFVAGATVCIWFVTFLVLPGFVGPWVLAKRDGGITARKGGATMGRVFTMGRVVWWGGAVAFVLVTLGLGRAAMGVRFNNDPRALDGSSAELRAEEEAFYRVWGDLRNRGIVLVRGNGSVGVVDELGRVEQYLEDQKRDGLIKGIASPAGILPDDATAKARAEEWKAYWNPERRAELKGMLASAARENGFKEEAFSGYADRVAEVSVTPADVRLAGSPAALFPGVVQLIPAGSTLDEAGYTIAVIVEMEDVSGAATPVGARSLRMATEWAGELRERFPEVTILSGNLLVFDATERAGAEGERLGPWCVMAILLPLWIYFRRLRSAWLTMTCLFVGFLWVLGAAQNFGGGLNLLSLVPVLFTLGVAVDYGIYCATDPAWRGDGQGNRAGVTFMCALTTILGSGALILAGHPVMRWLGITLVAGLAGGYLTSLYVVGPVTRRRFLRRNCGSGRIRPSAEHAQGPYPEYGTRALVPPAEPGADRRWWWRVAGWIPRMALGGVTLLLAVPLVVEVILVREKPAGVEAGRAHVLVRQVGPREYVAGDSWMRWREAGKDAGGVTGGAGMWEIKLVGDAEARGWAVGELAGPIDLRIENEMLDQLDYFLPSPWARWVVLRGVAANMVDLPRYVQPEYQQEIYWASMAREDPHAYLAPSYPRILSYHALHDISQMLIDNPLIVPNTFACTGVVSLPAYSGGGAEGHLMLARNFDFEGGESFGRQKSVTYVVPPDGDGIPFVHVAWPGLSGAVTGMNAERIGVFINAAATRDFRRIGTPTILMAREVLEHARTIEEAEAIIRRTQVFVSDIVVVADGKTGRARVFEKSPADTAAFDVERSAVVANQLVTPRFVDDPVNVERRNDGTTAQRFARARELLDRMEGKVTAEGLAGLLRDKKGLHDKALGLGNRNAIDGLIACHAVIMDVTAGKMWVAAWPYAEGTFVGIDVLAMLRRSAAGEVGVLENAGGAAPNSIAEDSMMVTVPGDDKSGWQRVLASRDAARDAAAALATGETAAALRLADNVIRDNPDFYLGHELRGMALLKGGDRAGAKVEFLKALELDPPYAQRRQAIEEMVRRCETP